MTTDGTTFSVETERRLQLLDVTDRVEAALPADATGTCTVFVRHTTCGVVVNEAESRLLGDVETFLRETVADEGWAHDELDGNADSHLRALLLGPSETLPVTDGSLDLGTWQSVLLVECDGPRTRTAEVRY
ncbi:secondary thiamine-phosphate synthase enzyme YjbQ [Salinirubellus salinus]|uniref:Secondary thiamine-phosphate synthase enzyme YjbQ n=1 Tax=Salinirubellus salinus TaxID=1364945 RepID=A0A9E7R822_9EURY|nr:secondary thiamine-phosphate synthase enzyme YjbQ [Salinirubellus salinus]UWM56318.1 secondary thiamine-phosphate synthase enzyme YjbQ [Salinirubellus salinus]